MDDSEFEDALARLSDPFAFSLRNAIWICGTAAIVLTLVVLKMMGLLH